MYLYSDTTYGLYPFVSTFVRRMRLCIDLTHSNELKFVILMYSVLSLIRILNILDSLVWVFFWGMGGGGMVEAVCSKVRSDGFDGVLSVELRFSLLFSMGLVRRLEV